MAALLEKNSVWTDKHVYDEAEKVYYENLAKGGGSCQKKVSLAGEVAKARERIKQSLENVDDIKIPHSSNINIQSELSSVKNEVTQLRNDFEELRISFETVQHLVKQLEQKLNISPAQGQNQPELCKKPASNVCKKPEVAKPSPDDEDDGVDLFASESEEEDDESKKVKEARVAAYQAKKSKKPVLIAKSNIILDVKPWDDETDMKELEKEVRTVTMDGLVWGASKLVPLAYGIHKLQISCVVEDDKVSVDELQEKLQEIEDYVQSVDIAAFNKV